MILRTVETRVGISCNQAKMLLRTLTLSLTLSYGAVYCNNHDGTSNSSEIIQTVIPRTEEPEGPFIPHKIEVRVLILCSKRSSIKVIEFFSGMCRARESRNPSMCATAER